MVDGAVPGQNVLVNSASGGVGTFAVQITKSYGAEVTGVCSTPNVEMVRSIGADHVIDYTTQDFTVGDHRYDLVLDNAGNRRLPDVRRVMAPDGLCLASFGLPEHDWLGPLGKLHRMRVFSRFAGQSFVELDQTRKDADIGVMKDLLKAGTVTPVVDRTFPLSEVAEAMNYLDTATPGGRSSSQSRRTCTQAACAVSRGTVPTGMGATCSELRLADRLARSAPDVG